MKKRFAAAAFLICFLFLTACSTAGTSSGTSQPPADSSKVEVSSIPEASSAAASSVEPVQYMSYEEYFSESRNIDWYNQAAWEEYTYTTAEGISYFGKNGVRFLPFEMTMDTYAVTETGLLLQYGGKVYEAHEPNELAKEVYDPYVEFPQYGVEILSRTADKYVFFVGIKKYNEPEKFKVCRIFRDTGKVDVIATEADVPGKLTELDIRTSTRFFVISHVPYEIPENCDPDEAMNIADRARRCTFIDTIRGVKVCDDDEEAYRKAMEELDEIEKREQAETDAASSK